MKPSPDSARIEVGEDSGEDVATLRDALRARGWRIVEDEGATVSLVVRTPSAAALSALVEPAHHGASVVFELRGRSDLSALPAPRPPSSEDDLEDATRAWSDRLEALEALGSAVALDELEDTLADPRCVDPALRRRLVHRIAARPTTDALTALVRSLARHRGSLGSFEALALGQAFARGRARFDAPGPFAIELDDPRDEAPTPLLSLFRAAGAYERLCDERGWTVHRALVGEVPWIDLEGSSLPSPLALMRALHEASSARVWLLGWVLPAAMPWSIWSALLGQRGR